MIFGLLLQFFSHGKVEHSAAGTVLLLLLLLHLRRMSDYGPDYG